jgi:hypothetical protein
MLLWTAIVADHKEIYRRVSSNSSIQARWRDQAASRSSPPVAKRQSRGGVAFRVFFAMICNMRDKPLSKFTLEIRSGIASLLVVAWIAMFTYQWAHHETSRSDLNVFTSTPMKIPGAMKQKIDNALSEALNSAQTKPGLIVMLFLLRFDLKQNLQTWPVLSGDLERSPPAPPLA